MSIGPVRWQMASVCLIFLCFCGLGVERAAASDLVKRDSLRALLVQPVTTLHQSEILLELARSFSGEKWDSVGYYALESETVARKARLWDIAHLAAFERYYALSYIGTADEIIEHGPPVVKALRGMNDTLRLIKSMNLMGAYGYVPLGRFTEAIEVYEECLSMIREDHRFVATYSVITNNLYRVFMLTEDVDRAVALHNQFLAYARKNQDPEGIVYANLRMANSYVSMDSMELAKMYYDKAEALLDDSMGDLTYDQVLSSKGQWYLLNGFEDSAIYYFTELVELTSSNADSASMDFPLLLLGKAYLWQGENIPKAIEYLESASTIAIQHRNFSRYIDHSLFLVDAYATNKEYSRAIKLGEDALKLSDSLSYVRGVYGFHSLLGSIYEITGDYQLSLKHFKECYRVEDTLRAVGPLNGKGPLRLDKQFALRFMLAERKRENERLKSAQQENEIAIQHREMLALGAFLALILSMGVGLFLYVSNRQRQQYTRQLQAEVDYRTADLQHLNTQLMRSNEDLERFAYITSHDLKEPIRNILSFVGLLRKRNQNLDKESLDFLGYIDESAHQMYRLVHDILAFSMLKNQFVSFAQLDLTELVAEVISQQVSTELLHKGKVIVGALPVIEGYDVQLRMLFKNLIENGLTYNLSDTPTVWIDCHTEEEEYWIEVRDNGIGIDRVYHDQLFQLFKRLHHRGEFEGTGVGLAICQLVVQNHGGNIWVDSKAGEGASFWFSIPFAIAPQDPSRAMHA